jgi:hypothetical protein
MVKNRFLVNLLFIVYCVMIDKIVFLQKGFYDW